MKNAIITSRNGTNRLEFDDSPIYRKVAFFKFYEKKGRGKEITAGIGGLFQQITSC
jgi:hypothetical protein